MPWIFFLFFFGVTHWCILTLFVMWTLCNINPNYRKQKPLHSDVIKKKRLKVFMCELCNWDARPHFGELPFPETTAGALTCLPCQRLMISSGGFQLGSRHAAARLDGGRGRCSASRSIHSLAHTRARFKSTLGQQTARLLRSCGLHARSGWTGCPNMNKHAHTGLEWTCALLKSNIKPHPE